MLSLEPNVVSRHTFVWNSYTVKWIQTIHVQALRRSMSIRGSPERLKTGNRLQGGLKGLEAFSAEGRFEDASRGLERGFKGA